MYNRAEVVDKNFIQFVREGRLPEARVHLSLRQSTLRKDEVVDLFESQVMSRHLDLRARELKNSNQCYYTIGSAGHEGNAAFGKAFRYTDMAFLHYRSGAFFIQRSKQLFGATPVYDLLLSFTASSEDPISGGRHKVFGSKPLFVPPQTSTIASHLPKAVGAALSIGRANDLEIEAEMPSDSVVVCNFGDASANHATALSAFNTASLVSYQHVKMPLVFICEDNHIGISVKTPDNWVYRNFSQRPHLEYISCDGLNLLDAFEKSLLARRHACEIKRPVFLHMDTVRLLGHAGSDVESTYQTLLDIEAKEFNDPLLHSTRILMENQILSSDEILNLYESVRKRIYHVSNEVVKLPKLETSEEVSASVTSCTTSVRHKLQVSETDREQVFGRDYKKLNQPMHMAKLINWGLHDLLLQYPNALVFGEDVAQKGGVYNVTDNLTKNFGARRVFNSPLDETSIIGTAIGLAHNGFLPLPEIQFLAYVHNAEDQIRGEAATLAFFSQGQYTNPMVLRIAGLGYQKGFGGHFHNDNSLAVFRDIPGLIVAVPSNGADAVKMLRACTREAYEKGRVVIFIEPIALYMTKDLHQEGDKLWSCTYPSPDEEISVGEMNTLGDGEDLSIITYGNGVYYSDQARKVLAEDYNIKSRVIDLRWIAPLNKQDLLENIKKDSYVLIVEECRKTGSLSEGIVTVMVEGLSQMPKIKIVAAEDCFVPLGKAASVGLPKKQEIVDGALALIGVKP